MATGAEVLIVGAGPAGIATAIAASQKGLRVTVVDARRPPIEQACGEGILPAGVSALRQLGIWLDSSVAFPIAGIRFSDETSSACGRITRGLGFGLRRSVLHELLVRRAEELGVSFRWGTRVSDLTSNSARLDGVLFRFHWLVGADGQKSLIKKWSGLGPRRVRSTRFGFRCHFAVAPWSDLVEVYWGERCQVYITPTGPDEICVAVLTSDPQLKVERAPAAISSGGQSLWRCFPHQPGTRQGHRARLSAQRCAQERRAGRRCFVRSRRNCRPGPQSCVPASAVPRRRAGIRKYPPLPAHASPLHASACTHDPLAVAAVPPSVAAPSSAAYIRGESQAVHPDDFLARESPRKPAPIKASEIFLFGWQVLRA